MFGFWVVFRVFPDRIRSRYVHVVGRRPPVLNRKITKVLKSKKYQNSVDFPNNDRNELRKTARRPDKHFSVFLERVIIITDVLIKFLRV